MHPPFSTTNANQRVPSEIWLAVVDVLIQQGLPDGRVGLEGGVTKLVGGHPHLKSLVHLASANKQFHSLIAPYLFSLFAGHVLLWAAESGRIAIAEDAIKAGASLDVRNQLCQTPLLLAAKNGHLSIVELLLLTTADGEMRTATRSALENTTLVGGERSSIDAQSHPRCLNINATDRTGMTPLGEAARQGHHRITRLLILHGASVVSRLQAGRTALHFAASGGNEEAVEALLKAETIINWNDGDMRGCSPLFLAAANGHARVIDFLMKYGASASISNLGGQTPLHIAAANGHGKVVMLLLRLPGVDRLATDWNGYTPTRLAARNGHFPLVMMLRSNRTRNIVITMGDLNVATKKQLHRFFNAFRHPRLMKCTIPRGADLGQEIGS